MGIGFAVPINMAVDIKDQLLTDGKVTRGYFGVMLNPGDLTPEMASSFGLQSGTGVLLADILPDSPAAKAGLKAGDIILELNGNNVAEVNKFRQDVARLRPNSKVKVVVFQDGRRKNLTITIGTAPQDDTKAEDSSESTEAAAQALGLTLQPLTNEIKAQLRIKDARGVLIGDVEPGSPAAREGLQPGDLIESVNRQAIDSPQDFAKIAATADKPILLQVRTPKGRRFVILRPDEQP